MQISKGRAGIKEYIKARLLVAGWRNATADGWVVAVLEVDDIWWPEQKPSVGAMHEQVAIVFMFGLILLVVKPSNDITPRRRIRLIHQV